MSSVNGVSSLNVDSSLALDCSSAGSAWPHSGWGVGWPGYSCNGYGNPKPPKKINTLSLGLGLGFSLAAFSLVLAYIISAARKKRNAKSKDKNPPKYELGHPPEYTSAPDPETETRLA